MVVKIFAGPVPGALGPDDSEICLENLSPPDAVGRFVSLH